MSPFYTSVKRGLVLVVRHKKARHGNFMYEEGIKIMDLRDFVSETLAQIINGVNDAKNAVDNDQVIISPRLDGTAANKGHTGIAPSAGDAPATMVNFDVSLSTNEGTGTKGGIGVVTGLVALGSSGHSSSETSSLSRVQFSVPVILQRKQSD